LRRPTATWSLRLAPGLSSLPLALHAARRVSVAFMRRAEQCTAQFRNGARFFVSLILTYSNKINFFHLLNGEIAA
jgi:hypothetical protein